MRLLYVEENPSVSQAVETLLIQEGYDVDTADSGKGAVKLAANTNYDLIILDMDLADLEGFEVIERVRKNGTDTLFLFQTGGMDHEVEAEGARAGVNSFLVKPFSKNDLIEGVTRVIGRAKFFERAAEAEQEAKARDERRGNQRFSSYKPARVIWPSMFECRVVDVSYGGASLQLPHPSTPLPPRFGLSIDSTLEVECEIRWRAGDKVGVKFL